jgi:predicted ATPase/class 3 adenylate cyclase
VICGSCGHSNSSRAKFCEECGTPISAQAPRRDPSAYTPKHLADKILTQKSAIEGERKQITVLFADVKGSMNISQGIDAEEWHSIMDRFFTILSEGVHRYDGTINQFTGDGIMALFGAPIAHEDHAQRACYAALYLGDELRRYADELRRTKGLSFSVRMGMNSGEVVVGKIGDDLRMDYTAQGHTVGLAARMEQLAEPGRVYLTEYTGKLISGFFKLRDLGQFRLKGANQPLRAFELRGVGHLRKRFDVSRARGLSKFVGRTDEMAQLEAALADAQEGRGQVMGIVAEGGMGKSRLCYEFAERCKVRGIRVAEAHAVSHGKMIPFLPILELLRGLFEITEHDSETASRGKIAGTLLLLDRELDESLPLMFEFLGVPDPERPVPDMAPDTRQERLLAIVRRFLQVRSQRQPAVIILEDLQWIDRASQAFLQNVVEVVAQTRTLLLLISRPEYQVTWAPAPNYQQLTLTPLGAEAATALLQDLLGTDPSVEGLYRMILERSAGNPFFIEEIVQELAESGSLEGQRSAYQLAKPMEDVAMPARIQSVLAARIDRLSERNKQVLHTAAVIGKRFTGSVVRAVAGLTDADLMEALHELTNAGFLYEHELFPEIEYAFRHPLTQEVAYHSQLSEHRAPVHRAAACAIEQANPDRLDESAALIAYHWESAGDTEKSVGWHRRAAEWVSLRQVDEALRHWHKVRELLQTLPESKETMALGAAVRVQILSNAWRVGIPEEEAAAIFAEGEDLAWRSGDLRVRAMLVARYATLRSFSGGPVHEYMRQSGTAVRLAEQTGDAVLRMALVPSHVQSLFSAGRLEEALRLTEETQATAPDDDLRLGFEISGYSPFIGLVYLGGAVLTEMGRLEEARREFERAIRLAREYDDTELLGWTHARFARLEFFYGAPRAALTHSHRAIALSERRGNKLTSSFAWGSLGWAHYAEAKWNDALAAFQEGLSITQERRIAFPARPRLLSGLAQTHMQLGNKPRALAFAEEGIALIRELGYRGYEAPVYLAKARVLLGSEDATARSHIESALDEASRAIERTRAKLYAPRVCFLRAELFRLLDDRTSRLRELREAHRLFGEIGAVPHAERLAQEL